MNRPARIFGLVALITAASGCSDVNEPVTVPVATLALTSRNQSIEVGAGETLTVVAKDVNGAPIANAQYTLTMTPASAGVLSNSVFTAASPGPVVITASAGTVSASKTLFVVGASPRTLELATPLTSLPVNGSAQLTVVLKDARQTALTGVPVVWQTSNAAVVTVTDAGMATGRSPGSAYLYARSGALVDSILLNVVGSGSLIASPSFANLSIGSTATIRILKAEPNGNTTLLTTATWSTSNSAVALVSGGNITAVGNGIANITASANGNQTVIPVQVGAFANPLTAGPGIPVQLSGNQHFASFNVLQGGSIQLTGDAVITVDDDIVVNGSITGDCFSLRLISAGKVLMGQSPGQFASNLVQLTCATQTAQRSSLYIEGRAGVQLLNGKISAAGPVRITNDPGLLTADFTGPPIDAGIDACIFDHVNLAPPVQPAGVDGQYGTAGGNGNDLEIFCRGTMQIRNTAALRAQDGGKGGAGIHQSNTFAQAVGGAGGNAGAVRIRVTGDLVYNGNNDIWSGRPGDGGAATAIGLPGSGDAGTSAMAIGGNGGNHGTGVEGYLPVRITVAGKVRREGTYLGRSDINVWAAGRGGAASATAADGSAATSSLPARAGGNATAVGGNGGLIGGLDLVQGTATLEEALTIVLPLVYGGGNGGSATARAGNGGDGNATFLDGAAGGFAHALGANGTNATTNPLLGATSPRGGDAGAATFSGGNGGNGYTSCSIGGRGGNGGSGGTFSGGNGKAGEGFRSGASSIATVTDAARGGFGGNGTPPGSGGAEGVNNILVRTTGTITGSFTAGAPGVACTTGQ